jgi:hypothetical protein
MEIEKLKTDVEGKEAELKVAEAAKGNTVASTSKDVAGGEKGTDGYGKS